MTPRIVCARPSIAASVPIYMRIHIHTYIHTTHTHTHTRTHAHTHTHTRTHAHTHHAILIRVKVLERHLIGSPVRPLAPQAPAPPSPPPTPARLTGLMLHKGQLRPLFSIAPRRHAARMLLLQHSRQQLAELGVGGRLQTLEYCAAISCF